MHDVTPPRHRVKLIWSKCAQYMTRKGMSKGLLAVHFLRRHRQNKNKTPQMKTYHWFANTGLRWAAAAVLAIGLVSNITAAETKTGKGGASDLMSKPLKTADDIEALQPGDTVAMACPKCKTVTVTTVTKEWKGNVTHTTTGDKHLCPACENAFEVTGHGKAKKETVVHKCKNCGSTDAFCCTVKGPTKGMEHKP